MNESEAKKQIENMVRFIEQEANEKYEEILDQTNQELEAWKNEFKHNKRTYWKNYYLAEKKRQEVAGKIAESKLKSSEDERVMKERQQIMVNMKKEARAKLTQAIKSNAKAYKKMLHDLVVEGLLKLMEPKVTIRATAADKSVVKGILAKAVATFQDQMSKVCAENKTKFNMNVDISMEEAPLKDSCIGGVWVMSAAYTARPDAIIVRNSLDARLDTCMEQLTPTLRALMFPEDEKRAKEIADSRAKAMKAMMEEHH
mmetsp:Transcript_8317/g.15423  ORF Transcript_8317/g.15423 Transcript_8317/m.15423 type:complete len:257 (+) Transcript_8317:58-828(+)|eukprot:CAMPEP_0197522178 /NCGR_PEP_ID=MMETSP1318-20131121/7355_1 /TAXON_ID=552666 /ORGANISM="Partenskyella glossopodia, Strain RCC365" /LENGTH=256 /DNA_ID=CAMNT_0043074463 /DNA_START=59 /DNA_END=829 /DNA_ORIENTATION=+